MYSYPRAILYAIILWAVTFLSTFFIYPLRVESPMLFASLRMLILALSATALTVMYFRDVEEHLIGEGIKLGAIWLLIAIALDQGPFVWGLMRLKFLDYLIDTGLSYLIYPIVTLGAGLLLSADKSSVEDSEASGHLPGTRTAIPPTPEKASSPRPSDSNAHA